MTQSTARVLTLLEMLQAGGTRTVGVLAERLAVDERTVRRYAQQLRDLDIPVESVRGRYGGYRLARHHRMPPLMLTDEEALAVVWALLLAGRSTSGPASEVACRSATDKVRRVVPASVARRIDAVLASVTTADVRNRAEDGISADASGARVLLELAEAARDRRPVAFYYTPRRGGAARRRVEPHGVVAHRGDLYLSGFDVARQVVRTYRIDRIADLSALDGTFAAPNDANLVDRVLGPLPAAPERHDVCVRIRADVEHVRNHIPQMLASVTPLAATEGAHGWVRVFLRAERLDWVAVKLAAIDREFIVEDPPALYDAIHALAQRLLLASSPPAQMPDRSGVAPRGN